MPLRTTRIRYPLESKPFDRGAVKDPLPAGHKAQRRRMRCNRIPFNFVPATCGWDGEANDTESNRKACSTKHSDRRGRVEAGRHVLHRCDPELELALGVAPEACHERAVGQRGAESALGVPASVLVEATGEAAAGVAFVAAAKRVGCGL